MKELAELVLAGTTRHIGLELVLAGTAMVLDARGTPGEAGTQG